MSKNLVQISLTNDERGELSNHARDAGLSLPLFIKSLALVVNGDEDIRNLVLDKSRDSYLGELMRLVSEFSTGWFNIRQLFGMDKWEKIEKTQKLILGKVFYNEVKAGNVLNVSAANKDAANTQWYLKSSDITCFEEKVSEELIEEIKMFMQKPASEIDRDKAFDYILKLSTAFSKGSIEFDAEVKKITEEVQKDVEKNGVSSDWIILQANRRLGKMMLTQNGYALKLFEQLKELAEKGKRL